MMLHFSIQQEPKSHKIFWYNLLLQLIQLEVEALACVIFVSLKNLLQRILLVVSKVHTQEAEAICLSELCCPVLI